MAHSVLGKHVSNAHHPTLNGNTEGNISQHWKYSHKARYDLNTDSNSPWLRRPLSLHESAEMKMSRCHLIAGEWPWIIWLSHSPQGTASWLQEVEWDLFCPWLQCVTVQEACAAKATLLSSVLSCCTVRWCLGPRSRYKYFTRYMEALPSKTSNSYRTLWFCSLMNIPAALFCPQCQIILPSTVKRSPLLCHIWRMDWAVVLRGTEGQVFFQPGQWGRQEISFLFIVEVLF